MKTEKTSCKVCYGLGQVERGSAGPIDCPACKGVGTVKVIKRVEHFDPVKINIERGRK